MPKTLFALVRNGEVKSVHRISVTAAVQDQLDQMFEDQERAFVADINEHVIFSGLYKPDMEELLYIDDEELVQPITSTLVENAAAFAPLDVGRLEGKKIAAVFRESTIQAGRILLQTFSVTQFLSNSGLSLILKAGTYNKLEEPGFSLDNKITAYIEGGRTYFKSFYQLRTALTIQEHFVEATQANLEAFAAHEKLSIENIPLFLANADQTCRRLVGGISRSDILNAVAPDIIVERARSVNVDLVMDGDRIKIPGDKREMKMALRFLEESVYKGLLTEAVFLSNSKRPVDRPM